MTIRCNKATWYSRAEGEPLRKKSHGRGAPLKDWCSASLEKVWLCPLDGREVGSIVWVMALQSLGKQEATLWGTNGVQTDQLMVGLWTSRGSQGVSVSRRPGAHIVLRGPRSPAGPCTLSPLPEQVST